MPESKGAGFVPLSLWQQVSQVNTPKAESSRPSLICPVWNRKSAHTRRNSKLTRDIGSLFKRPFSSACHCSKGDVPLADLATAVPAASTTAGSFAEGKAELVGDNQAQSLP